QGNMNIKHVRRIQLIDQPAMSFYESKTYSQILPDGKMWLFHFTQEVKSFITHPSFGQSLKGPGFYEISGIAYSGNGRISKVMVSADGGENWAQAALPAPVNSQGVHALPHAVALGWPAGDPAKPRVGRRRQRAAAARRVRGGARTDREAGGEPPRLPQPALQQHHQLGYRQLGRDQACLCINRF